MTTGLIATITPASVPVVFCCNGNTIKWGSRLYFSSGASGTGAFLEIGRAHV